MRIVGVIGGVGVGKREGVHVTSVKKKIGKQ